MHQSTTRPIIKFNLLRARVFVFTRILNAVSLTFEPTRNHGDHACNHRKPSVQDGFQEHHNSSNSAHPCGSSSSACGEARRRVACPGLAAPACISPSPRFGSGAGRECEPVGGIYGKTAL